MFETRAAVVRPGSGTFTWENVRLEDPRPDEVVVRVVGAGICHTDLATRDEKLHTPMPAVLGHEGAGVVEAVGSAVTRVAVGDHVLLSFSSCGHCSACQHGHPGYCETFIARNFGGRRPDGTTPISTPEGEPLGGRFFGQSSFSVRAVVDERSVVAVETSGEDELALLAPIGCGVQTGAGAILNELRPGAGDTVAVFGAGAVGLSAVMAAALTPATRVIAIDIVPSRLELALEVGATDVINGREEDTAARLAEITGGRGLTHALESSGVPALLRQAIDSLAVGGTVAVVGAPATGTDGTFDVNFLLNGRSIRGVTEGDSDVLTFIPALVDLYRAGRLPFDRMIRTYRPEEINEAAADAASGAVLKPVLRFPS
ncbi:NAD(P)-dependent alcohol dehydrogenase [Marinactinospora thermotolerans]|uniref:Aryl-alcohol dehydrogenase n=1 Tax=Marinactinospora thermotolerans DSM 45154 TaxID=1122192 RepID=A0A1T4NHV9_9ACTN|nr:NAD(P)-dependent alcohol dehydrogenase [Marinactinospora thermotolerans]SJZ78870.1 aryl-alcohol dehydrogenase [Marinactinospora thermotolerans DSM 45154]